MAAMTASGPMVHTSDEAELLACQRAIEFAVNARFSRMIIKGDNINVVHAISSSMENTSPFGNVVTPQTSKGLKHDKDISKYL